MTINAKPVSHGTAGGATINVDMSRVDHSAPKKVLLTANYTTTQVAGTPSRPSMTGCAVANLDYARTIPSGTTLTLLAAEADALVAAGKATYA